MSEKKLDLIHGAEAIGKAIGKTPRQAFWLLETGKILGAVKVGRSWAVSYRLLAKQFGVEVADQGEAA